MQTKKLLITGWTSTEIKALKRMAKRAGTDQSKLIRSLVRQADAQEAMSELGATGITLYVQEQGQQEKAGG